jgi:hypothetical protein
MLGRCNTAALYERLDAARIARDLSWRDVSHQVGVSPSCFSRLTRGDAPNAHSLAAMLTWIGATPWWATPDFPTEPPP